MEPTMRKFYLPLILSLYLAPLYSGPFLDNIFGSSSKKKDEETNVKEDADKTESAKGATDEQPAKEKAPEPQKNKEVKCFDPSKGFADVAEHALPAVVNVATTQVVENKEEAGELSTMIPGFQGSPFEDLFKRFMDQGAANNKPRKVQSLGSGFIIQADEKAFYVVTNFHVVQDAKKIKIFMDNKTEVEGKLHACDERTDLAVIKVNLESLPSDKRNVTVLEWGNTESSRVGDWVIAIGNPFGFGSSVTVGVLSHKGRDTVARGMGRLSDYVDDYIQHSAQINFGNSGGCLLDTCGKVIGVNTAIISPSGGNVGIGFAIPAHIAKATVKQLIEFGRTKRGWLGVKIQPFTEEMAESIGQKELLTNKPIVMNVTKDGPAEKAGIEREDIILEFNNKVLDGQSKLFRLVGETPVGTTVPIKVWRKGGKEVVVNVTVGEYEDAEQKGQLNDSPKAELSSDQGKVQDVIGLTMTPLTNQLKERLNFNEKSLKGGVVVLKVDPAKAADLGIIRGDIVVQVNQKDVATPQDFSDIVEHSKKEGKKNILLLIMRKHPERFGSSDRDYFESHYISVKIVDEDDDVKKATPQPEKKEEAEKKKDSDKATEAPAKNDQKVEEKESVPDNKKPDNKATLEHPGNKPKAAA